ncbi:hypothetical protein CM15mP43_07780 [bacterium]|nr:CDP-alcohol phosphatidyltransferase family protein [bacterium]GIR29154.1 MAG: hypothetical protein CM15mP43_07780 [bacterium]|tara:strand:+ start:4932 stop:6164 length:1233 start_codon:yes stop_codon:yes gene_type:complete
MSPAIIVDGKDINNESIEIFLDEKIAGISNIERLIINLQNEGFKKVYIVANKNLEIKLKKIKKPIELKLITHKDLCNLKEDILLFQSNVVLNKKQLSDIVELTSNSNDSYSFKNQNEYIGVSYVKKDLIMNIFIDNSLNKKLILNIDSFNLKDPPLLLSKSQIGTKIGRDFLFSHISKNVSGWVSKNINSKISIPVSKLLIRTNLHPNTITLFVGCLGISCGFLYANNNALLGALILQLSTILDRCDGEVARIKLKESKFGQWFDTALDQLSYFSMFIGIAICLNNPNYFPLTNINIIIKQFSIINVLLYIIFITTVLFFMIRRTSNGSLAYYPGEVDKRVPLNERSFLYRLISKYRFVLKREFFSPAMIFGSLLGYKFLAITALILFIFGLYHQVSDYIALRERTDITY